MFSYILLYEADVSAFLLLILLSEAYVAPFLPLILPYEADFDASAVDFDASNADSGASAVYFYCFRCRS